MRILSTLLIAGLMFMPVSLPATEDVVDSPPVVRLKRLIAQQPEFRETVTKMLAEVKDHPSGLHNPWHGRTIEDLYAFVNDWFYFLPDAHNGLDRIMEFSLLYYDNSHGREFVLEEPGLSWTQYFVEKRGEYLDSPASTAVIDSWLADSTIDHAQFVSPSAGFQSFNEFFTRDLVSGARPVTAPDDTSTLVAPADGILNLIDNNLTLDKEIPTKGLASMSLRALLGNSAHAARFVGGSAMAVFLMPDDYHHFHAPVSGLVLESDSEVGDRLFGVPDLLDIANNGNPGYGKDYSVFEQFRHGYFIIDAGKFGLVGMIPIGLQTVGSVVFEPAFDAIDGALREPRPVRKGERLGHFAYGGSTVLLIFEPGAIDAVSVRQGQQIGRLRP